MGYAGCTYCNKFCNSKFEMAKVKKTKYAQDMLFEDLFPVHDAMLVLISSPIELSKYNCFHSGEATFATVKIIQ